MFQINSQEGLALSPNAEKFLRHADSIRERAGRFGKTVRGYSSRSLPLFQAAPTLKQELILNSLALLDQSLASDEEGADADFFEAEKRSLWKSLRLLGYVPPAELFNELKPNRAIEIFGLDGGLQWRNLSCMDLCSYTLEEIACIDVFDRYVRTPGIYEQCLAQLQAMLAGKTPEVVDPQIAAHTIIETTSAERLILSIKHEIGAILRNRQGEVGAWLVMSDAKVVGTDLPPPAPRTSRLSVVS